MTEAILEIPITRRENQRSLRLDKSFREAIRDHLKRRWPYGTAKAAALEYGLTEDRAREAAAGRCSLTTMEAIFKAGGPPVFLPVMEEVWGESIAAFYAEQRKRNGENAARFGALVGAARPLAGDRSSGAGDLADREDPGLGARRSRVGF